jgi:rhamnogalacturonyl hydrolase YesR
MQIIAANPFGLVLPYQKKWILDTSRFKIWLKSRQIGGSLAAAYEIANDAISNGSEWIILSAGGRKLGTHEIFRANVGLTDTRRDPHSWRPGIYWEPLTRSSPGSVQNIRPVIVRDGDQRIVLWNRGFYGSYSNYQMDTVGIMQSLDKTSPIANPFSQEGILQSMELAMAFEERAGRLGPGWIEGTFYGGVFEAYQATGKKTFLDAARRWTASPLRIRHGVNADPICTAQTYLDVYFIDRNPENVERLKEIFETEYFGVDVVTREKIVHASWKEDSRPFTGRNVWWWCDALYMAPPVIARMAEATGDPRYLELLHELFWDSVDFLYDPEERLFYRDDRFFTRKTPRGQPVFWGRGNGWVIGGLVRTLDYIPESDPMRPKYIQLFQDMMERITSLQSDDGLWRAALNEPDWYPMKESSGSAFFVCGLAAGINRGWLDRETYMPALAKGWLGLTGILSPEGKVQWSQQVAYGPYATKREHTTPYTQGAFLLAAAEVYKLGGFPKVESMDRP